MKTNIAIDLEKNTVIVSNTAERGVSIGRIKKMVALPVKQLCLCV